MKIPNISYMKNKEKIYKVVDESSELPESEVPIRIEKTPKKVSYCSGDKGIVSMFKSFEEKDKTKISWLKEEIEPQYCFSADELKAFVKANFKAGADCHWFHTLMAQVLHIGEYMKLNGRCETPETWGNQLNNIAKDMMEWYKSEQNSKDDSIHNAALNYAGNFDKDVIESLRLQDDIDCCIRDFKAGALSDAAKEYWYNVFMQTTEPSAEKWVNNNIDAEVFQSVDKAWLIHVLSKFAAQFQSEQKPLTYAEIKALAENEYPEQTTWEIYHREGFIEGYKAALNNSK